MKKQETWFFALQKLKVHPRLLMKEKKHSSTYSPYEISTSSEHQGYLTWYPGYSILPNLCLKNSRFHDASMDRCHRRYWSYDTWLKHQTINVLSPMLRKTETFDILQSLFIQKPKQPTAKTQETLSTETKAFSSSWNFFGSYSSMRYQLSFHLEKNYSRWTFSNCD